MNTAYYVFRAHEWIMVFNAISNRAVEQDQSYIANMISKCDGLCEYVNDMHSLSFKYSRFYTIEEKISVASTASSVMCSKALSPSELQHWTLGGSDLKKCGSIHLLVDSLGSEDAIVLIQFIYCRTILQKMVLSSK